MVSKQPGLIYMAQIIEMVFFVGPTLHDAKSMAAEVNPV
jgi:hypothetical protein